MSERCKNLQSDMLLWGRGGLDNLFQWGRDQPAVYDPDGNIYFITDGEAIKIGYSTAPEVRMANLQGAHYRELRIMFAMPGKVDDEAALHEKFRRLWIRGEWFRAERELLDFIEEKRSL